MEAQVNTMGITKIYNLIILDESGSMSSIYEQALGGANETIQTIRTAQSSAADQKQYLTFVTFDSGAGESVRTVIDTMPIEQVKDLTRDDYRPNGCTPLYDAMGKSLTALERKVSDDDQVLVTIITDGYENSSREYDSEKINKLIKRLDEKDWVFTYIGANQDAILEARKIGINNAMNYDADERGTREMWEKERRSRTYFMERARVGTPKSRLKSNYFENEEKNTRDDD